MDTNSIVQLQQLASSLPPSWHGLTILHLLIALLSGGWATHANWPKIVAGLLWLRANGGGVAFLWSALIYNGKPKSQAPPPPSGT